MKDFLHYLVSQIVTQPDQISIEERLESDQNQTAENQNKQTQQHLILNLKVSEEDMGLIIGKNGKVIASLRTLLKLRNQNNRQYLSASLQLEEKAYRPQPQ